MPRRDRSRAKHVMSKENCIERGLYVGPDYQVDLASFELDHPWRLSDGRRFASPECALKGAEPDLTVGFDLPRRTTHPAIT